MSWEQKSSPAVPGWQAAKVGIAAWSDEVRKWVSWNGPSFCPCHRSKFDLAGRVYTGVPAVLNLLVPPYSFPDDDHVVIGVDPQGAA